MADLCSVCLHFRRAALEQALADGASIRSVVRDFGVYREALLHHYRNHPRLTEQQIREEEVLAIEAPPESLPDPDAKPVDPVTVAIAVLEAIAEDMLMRPSYRVRARKHLRELRRGAREELTASDFADAEPDQDGAEAE